MINVTVVGDKEKKTIEGGLSGIELIKLLGLSLDSTIILRDGKPIPEDEIIEEGSEVTVIKSFSGG